MSQRRIYTESAPIDFAGVRSELGIPADFPPAVTAAAVAAAESGPWIAPDRRDRTDLPLVTLDPPGSKDLDQAVLITRAGDGFGFRVHYAIADVAAWVRPDSVLEAESLLRGETLYSPDRSTPLHPLPMSEGAGSLLPDQRRPAVLWTIDLDSTGEPTAVDLERVWVRSIARLDYPTVDAELRAGTEHPSIALLPDVGKLRQGLARQRHAIMLNLPDVQIRPAGDGWRLELRAQLEIEQYNAEISLLTGMAAARIMLDGGVGILRTLPDPTDRQITELRHATRALGIPWPDGVPPGDVIAQLDPSDPRQAAFIDHAARLLRGAAYTPFDQQVPDHEKPELTEHAGIGAPYAHVTAPLRRLVDRFGTEVCLALHAGTAIPDWARGRLFELPKVMSAADQRANALEKACIGAVAAFLLAGREGDTFTGTVLQIDEAKQLATVVLDDPPVRAKCPSAGVQEGENVTVVLVAADPSSHTYTVRLADLP